MWFTYWASSGNNIAAMAKHIAAKMMAQFQLGKAQDLARQCMKKKY
jgi:hypothetical protein